MRISDWSSDVCSSDLGQSCIAAKRFIVHEAVADDFEARFVERLEELKVGHPLDEGTDVGPLATEQGRTDVEELVADAVAKGARVLTGGTRQIGRASGRDRVCQYV